MLRAYGTLLERLVAMFDLMPRPGYRLARPPLVQALAQVRYPLRARLQTLDGVALVQDRLELLFPYMAEQHVQQVSLLVSPGAPAQAESQTSRSWQFTNDDGWTLTLAADAATQLQGIVRPSGAAEGGQGTAASTSQDGSQGIRDHLQYG